MIARHAMPSRLHEPVFQVFSVPAIKVDGAIGSSCAGVACTLSQCTWGTEAVSWAQWTSWVLQKACWVLAQSGTK